jgi:hypothetical protein
MPMTLHSTGYMIICERPGCGRQQPLGDKTEAKAIASATAMGWARVDDKDYCPDHALAAKAAKVALDNPV